jgi:hypothetical protein
MSLSSMTGKGRVDLSVIWIVTPECTGRTDLTCGDNQYIKVVSK